MIRESISPSRPVADSRASTTSGSRSRVRTNCRKSMRVCVKRAATSSSKDRPPVAMRSRKNRGSTIRPASRGKLFSPRGKTQTTATGAESAVRGWRMPRHAARLRSRRRELLPPAVRRRALERRSERVDPMRLYLFEHCSLCFRVRMAAALKRMHLQETVVLEDDSETMTSLVGKRAVPILITDDGQPMLESMDMVRYIDRLGDAVLTGAERPEIAAWAERVPPKTALLTWPRYPLLGLPEVPTSAALDHYNLRKRKAIGDFVELRANTRRYIDDLLPDLAELDRLIESPRAVSGALSTDDIRVLPLLRSMATVKGLPLPRKVREYFETMMHRIGYQPLPAV